MIEQLMCRCGNEAKLTNSRRGQTAIYGVTCDKCGVGIFQGYEYRVEPDASEEFQDKLEKEQTERFKNDIIERWSRFNE